MSDSISIPFQSRDHAIAALCQKVFGAEPVYVEPPLGCTSRQGQGSGTAERPTPITDAPELPTPITDAMETRIAWFGVEHGEVKIVRKSDAAKLERQLADATINADRYRKLRRWMSSNVSEGWDEVKRLGAVACYTSWEEFNAYLDELPECNVGLCYERPPEAGNPASTPPADLERQLADAPELPTPITEYQNRGGEIWEKADGKWHELFAADAIKRMEHYEAKNSGLERQLAEVRAEYLTMTSRWREVSGHRDGLLWCLRELSYAIPSKRDWLNPDLEKIMNGLLEKPQSEGIEA